jgi:PAS domain-containing protein
MPFTGDSVQAQLERCQRRARVLRGIFVSARSQQTAEGTISAFLSEVCRGFNWPLGLYVAGHDGGSAFLLTELRFPPDGAAPNAVRSLLERSRGDGAKGLDAEIVRAGAPRWIPNVTLDPTFEAAKQAVALGLRGLVGIPIETSGRIYGIAEFFTREEFNPSPDQVDYLSDLGHLLGASVHLYELDRRVRKIRQEQEVLFAQARDPIYIVDGTGRATFVNEPAARLFGRPAGDLVGKSIHDLYHRPGGDGTTRIENCNIHSLRLRALAGAQSRETFQTAGNRHVEVDVVAAPFVVNGTAETIIMLRLT